MTTENSNQLIQQLKPIIPNFCDKCGAKYSSQDLEIVQNDREKAVCKLACKTCGNNFVMHVNSILDGMGMLAARSLNSPIGATKSEISAKEQEIYNQLEEIEADEIIDVFTALKKVKNIEDFNSLF